MTPARLGGGLIPSTSRPDRTAAAPPVPRRSAPGSSEAAAGALLEAIGAFFLVTVVFGTAVHPQAPRVGGLAIGLVITMDILAFGPLTGAAVNPARAFGPALVSGAWAHQLVYWIGPLLGGGVAGWLYSGVYLGEAR